MQGDCCEMDACGWVTFVILLLCFWPLCWIPFVCDECRVVSSMLLSSSDL
jgi:hypothetical protein